MACLTTRLVPPTTTHTIPGALDLCAYLPTYIHSYYVHYRQSCSMAALWSLTHTRTWRIYPLHLGFSPLSGLFPSRL